MADDRHWRAEGCHGRKLCPLRDGGVAENLELWPRWKSGRLVELQERDPSVCDVVKIEMEFEEFPERVDKSPLLQRMTPLERAGASSRYLGAAENRRSTAMWAGQSSCTVGGGVVSTHNLRSPGYLTRVGPLVRASTWKA